MKVAIAGCGSIGRLHAGALKEMENMEITAVADCIFERAQSYAEEFGNGNTRVYTSVEKMLDEEELEGVHICTPHYLHVPMAVYALKKGMYVFMEKPPAMSADEFTELREAEKKSGKNVGICFQNRYNETTDKAEEVIKSGLLGKPKGARAFVTWNRQEGYYLDSGWRGKWGTEGGGVLINQSIHTLDLLVYLLGRPEEAEASVSNHHLKKVIEVEDTIEAYIRFSESTACFYATTAYGDDSPVFLEILFEKGNLRIEGDTLEIRQKDGSRERYDFCKKQEPEGKAYWGNSHGTCIRDFYRCIQENRDFRNSLEHTEDTFLLAMKMYDSAFERQSGNVNGIKNRKRS